MYEYTYLDVTGLMYVNPGTRAFRIDGPGGTKIMTVFNEAVAQDFCHMMNQARLERTADGK
jgi:hypothetical protein